MNLQERAGLHSPSSCLGLRPKDSYGPATEDSHAPGNSQALLPHRFWVLALSRQALGAGRRIQSRTFTAEASQCLTSLYTCPLSRQALALDAVRHPPAPAVAEAGITGAAGLHGGDQPAADRYRDSRLFRPDTVYLERRMSI
jgi:hypothetical protein